MRLLVLSSSVQLSIQLSGLVYLIIKKLRGNGSFLNEEVARTILLELLYYIIRTKETRFPDFCPTLSLEGFAISVWIYLAWVLMR